MHSKRVVKRIGITHRQQLHSLTGHKTVSSTGLLYIKKAPPPPLSWKMSRLKG